MTEGTTTYNGLGVPLYGESEIKQQTAATDLVTLTGSTGTQTGDFIVCQNSTGAELFTVSSAGHLGMVLASTALDAITVNVTSTGAIAAGTAHNSILYVQASSKSVLNSIVTYVSTCTGGEVGTCNAFLTAHGSKAPTYLFSVGSTATGVGAGGTNGFVTAGLYLSAAVATTVATCTIKILLGDSPWYIPAWPTTAFAAS